MSPTLYRTWVALACFPPLLAACAPATPVRAAASVPAGAPVAPQVVPAARFVREELYFGVKRRGRGVVSDTEWVRFLREVVTPQFPEGLTVLQGRGQYRLWNGAIIEEGTHLLVVLYEREPEIAAGNK